MTKRGSLTSAKSLHELKHDRSSVDDDEPKDKKTRCLAHKTPDPNCSNCNVYDDDDGTKTIGIRPSKSDTSITDSFVVVDNDYSKKKNQNALREGK